MFLRNLLALWQKSADPRGGCAMGFAMGAGLRHAGAVVRHRPVPVVCGVSRAPSQPLAPAVFRGGRLLVSAPRAARALHRQTAAHSGRSRGFVFSVMAHSLDSGVITTPFGGRATCVSPPFFWPLALLRQRPAARNRAMVSPECCKPSRAAPLPAPFWARLQPMPWMKTSSPAPLWAALPVAQAAASRGCRPATDLTAAQAAREPVTRAIGASRPGGLIRFAQDCARRPACC